MTMYIIHYKDGTTQSSQMSLCEAKRVSMLEVVNRVEVIDNPLYIDDMGYYKVKGGVKFYVKNK